MNEYVFEGKYYPMSSKISEKDIQNIRDCNKLYSINDNFGEYEKEDVLDIFNNRYTPKVVGFFRIMDEYKFSLPGCISYAQNDKQLCLECENNLLEIFRRFPTELSRRDSLFNKTSSGKTHSKFLLIRELKNLYNKYGKYSDEVIKYGNKGSVSWSQTIKKCIPDTVNGVSVYRNMIKRESVSELTDITHIEQMIFLNAIDEGYLSCKDLRVEALPHSNFDFNKKSYLRLIESAILTTYEDAKIQRLKLMKEYLAIDTNKEELKEREFEYFQSQDLKRLAKEKKLKNKEILVIFRGIYKKDGMYNKIIVNIDLSDYYTSYEFDIIGKCYESIKTDKIQIGDIIWIKLDYDGKYNKVISWEKSGNKSIKLFSSMKFDAVGLAKFDHIFELLLDKFFGSQITFDMPEYIVYKNKDEKDNKTRISIRPNMAFASNISEKFKVDDINEDEYRPFEYHFNKEEKYCFIPRNEYRCDANYTNYPDVIFDDEYNGKSYCVVIDAKNYKYSYALEKNGSGLINDDLAEAKVKETQFFPSGEAVFKQFYYEDMFTRIYEKNNTSVDYMYNIFILPKRAGKNADFKEDTNLYGCENKLFGKGKLFDICGYLTDDLKKQSIIVIRTDVDILMKKVLGKNTEKEKRENRKEFLTTIHKYIKIINNDSKNEKLYYRQIYKVEENNTICFDYRQVAE